MEREKTRIIVFLLMCILPISLCFGEDERSRPIEVYVMFDNSISMQDSKQQAADWISGHITDEILQANDLLTIWSIADAPVQEFSEIISDTNNIDQIKTVLSSIAVKDSTADYSAAFKELSGKLVPNPQYAYSYIILATGISGNTASLFSAEAANVLKYSRSKDFPGWKIMIIGLGIEQKVKTAAAAYMSSQR
ncbi:MAG: hypothetical protein LBV20_01715 [Treponema sp.]|jgi:hypothetical protein|nr:hypothetical protein [Treponema sp.]